MAQLNRVSHQGFHFSVYLFFTQYLLHRAEWVRLILPQLTKAKTGPQARLLGRSAHGSDDFFDIPPRIILFEQVAQLRCAQARPLVARAKMAPDRGVMTVQDLRNLLIRVPQRMQQHSQALALFRPSEPESGVSFRHAGQDSWR